MAALSRRRNSKAEARVTDLAGKLEAAELAVLEAERAGEQAAALLDDLAVLEARGEKTPEQAEQDRAKLSQRAFDTGEQAAHRRRVLEALRREHQDAKRVADEARFTAVVEDRDAAVREAVEAASRFVAAAASANDRAVELEAARAKVDELHSEARRLCPDGFDVPGLPVDEPDFADVSALTRVADRGPAQPVAHGRVAAERTALARANGREVSIRAAVKDLLGLPGDTDAMVLLREGRLSREPESLRGEIKARYEAELDAIRAKHGEHVAGVA